MQPKALIPGREDENSAGIWPGDRSRGAYKPQRECTRPSSIHLLSRRVPTRPSKAVSIPAPMELVAWSQGRCQLRNGGG